MGTTFTDSDITGLISGLLNKACASKDITRGEALLLSRIPQHHLFELFSAANRIKNYFRGSSVDLCAIINAKSGACPEDCSYCAQSSSSTAGVAVSGLTEKSIVLEKAAEAKSGGARRFCIVTSGRAVSRNDIQKIAEMVSSVRTLGMLPCATLGLLTKTDLALLKDSGLERYHHNLETSRRFFTEICTTHSYEDKIRTIRNVLENSLSLCSGGIFGLGETWEDRIDMALELRNIGPDSVPVNFLTPVQGTRLDNQPLLNPLEALQILSIYRFILPDREIRVCGGRLQTLGELNPLLFISGADGLLIGNYLTTLGRRYEDDLALVRQLGLEPLPCHA